MIKKIWTWLIIGIGAIGSILGIVAITIFRNGQEDEKIDEYLSDTDKLIDKIKDEEKKTNEKMPDIVDAFNALADGKLPRKNKKNTE